jgi:hypothetical protein
MECDPAGARSPLQSADTSAQSVTGTTLLPLRNDGTKFRFKVNSTAAFPRCIPNFSSHDRIVSFNVGGELDEAAESVSGSE